jgi:hypothetical protein
VSFWRSAASKTLECLRFFEIWGIACTVMACLIPEERMRLPHLCEYHKTPTSNHFSRNLCNMYRNGSYPINYHKVWNSAVCVEPYSVLLTCCAQYAVICLCCYLNPLPKAITLHYEYTTPVYLAQRTDVNFDSLVFTTERVQFIFCETIRTMTTRSCDLTIYSVFFLRVRAEAEEPSRRLLIQKFASRFCCLQKSLYALLLYLINCFSPFVGVVFRFESWRLLQFRSCRNMYEG